MLRLCSARAVCRKTPFREVIFGEIQSTTFFKLVTPNADIDWLIAHELSDNPTTQVAQDAKDVRWQVEEFYRELKHLIRSETYQCRKARSQRNHIACC
jgi:hypothetical protein